MTIGMFVESLAGKAGALHGLAQDSTPFRFDEQNTAVDYFGHQLKKAGYNYYGNEPMYSGITGQELAADIYIGVVYYQRLRHMVNDKYQVRTTGPVNSLTGQLIPGWEMENEKSDTNDWQVNLSKDVRRVEVFESERWSVMLFSLTARHSCSRIA